MTTATHHGRLRRQRLRRANAILRGMTNTAITDATYDIDGVIE
jgi:hypothetical protein